MNRNIAESKEAAKTQADAVHKLAQACIDLAVANGTITKNSADFLTRQNYLQQRKQKDDADDKAAADEIKMCSSTTLYFKFGEEAILRKVIDKFIEWDSVASTNSTQPFEKLIVEYRDPNDRYNESEWQEVIRPASRHFTFEWHGDDSGLPSRSSLIDDSGNKVPIIIYKNDVLKFRELLKFLPDLKQELAEKIRASQTQNALFR